MASSTELSTTSQIRWCRPTRPVEPMYMPGRLRTGSRPSRTWMADASYSVNLPLTSFAKARPFGVREISAEPSRVPGSMVPDGHSGSFSRCSKSTAGVCQIGGGRALLTALARADPELDPGHLVDSRHVPQPGQDIGFQEPQLRCPRGVVDLDDQAPIHQRRRPGVGRDLRTDRFLPP